MSQWNKKKKSYRWCDDKGNRLSGGGLIVYDDEGVWLIGEKDNKQFPYEVKWGDPGGKYKYEDCDIFTTIAREFSEEVYFSSELTKSQVEEIDKNFEPLRLTDDKGNVIYICYPVTVDFLNGLGVYLDQELFLKNRKKAISQNPDVPADYFSSIDIRYFKWEDIKNGDVILSHRFHQMLFRGHLREKVISNSQSMYLNI